MKKGSAVVWILIVLLLAGGAGYYFYSRGMLRISVGTPETQPVEEKQVVGGDRDEHGCIGSAGYSWCEVKSKCLRVWEEPCEKAGPVPTVDETAAIIADVRKALRAEHGDSVNELNISVSKIAGNYAQGGASASGGGGMWLAAKTGSTWKVIWNGNGVIFCTVFDPYPDFPQSMVAECWDDVNDKNVIR